MKTIDRILKEAWYTKEDLLVCEIKWHCNGMWSKWGIQWTDRARNMKYFQDKKHKTLLQNLDYISDIHDIDCNKWGFIIAFFKANYILAIRMLELLNWTSISSKVSAFILIFLWTNIFWIRTFNWHL